MATQHEHAGHDVRATYHSVNEARSALLALERRGVDAAEIEVEGAGAASWKLPVTNDRQLAADLQFEKHLERRAGGGLVIGGVVGALIGMLAGWVIWGGDPVGVVVGSAVAGAMLGVGLGFLWGGFSAIAVNEGFADTYAAVDDHETVVVVVHADDDHESVVEALQGTNPSSLRVA